MSTEIGAVYANALFSLAKETGESVLLQTRSDLRECAILFSLNPELTRLLSLPTLSAAERQTIASNIFGTEGLVSRLILLLVDHGRVAFLGEIADTFDARMLDYQNTIQVQVTTAVGLSEAQKERLSEQLSQKLGKAVLLHERIDRSILGGVIIRYGDTRIDNSLNFRLETLRQRLTATERCSAGS